MSARNAAADAELMDGARMGSVEDVRRALSGGASVDAVDELNNTPLHLAAAAGSTAAVQSLLEAGADPTVCNAAGHTALDIAVFGENRGCAVAIQDFTDGGDTISAAVSNEANIALRKATRVGNVDGARAALGAGASVFVADKSGNTALHWACINRHPTLVSVLLSADANPNAANRNGNTPLHAACSKGLATAVERLLAAGADPTLLDAKGDNAHDVALAWGSDRCAAIVSARLEEIAAAAALAPPLPAAETPPTRVETDRDADYDRADPQLSADQELLFAAAIGDVDMTQTALDRGANASAVDGDGSSALHLACVTGEARVVTLLVEADALVNAVDARNHCAPLHLASAHFDPGVVSLLLSAGAVVAAVDAAGCTALFVASRHGRARVLAVLLEAGSDPAAVDASGATARDVAALHSHAACVELLDAALDAGNAAENEALLQASRDGSAEGVRAALSAAADISAVDALGNTSLHLAAVSGHVGVMRLLLDAEAAVEPTNNDDHTPMHDACRQGRALAAGLLLEAGADPNGALAPDATTPLHYACRNGHVDVVSLLLAARVEVAVVERERKTPLHWASAYGRTEVANLLLEAAASVAAVDLRRRTPLHAACYYGRTAVVRLLLAAGADVSATDAKDETPVEIANRNGKIDCAEAIAAFLRGGDDDEDDDGDNAVDDGGDIGVDDSGDDDDSDDDDDNDGDDDDDNDGDGDGDDDDDDDDDGDGDGSGPNEQGSSNGERLQPGACTDPPAEVAHLEAFTGLNRRDGEFQVATDSDGRPLPRPGGSSFSIGIFIHAETGQRWVGKASVRWPPPAENPGAEAESESAREAIGMLTYSLYGVETPDVVLALVPCVNTAFPDDDFPGVPQCDGVPRVHIMSRFIGGLNSIQGTDPTDLLSIFDGVDHPAVTRGLGRILAVAAVINDYDVLGGSCGNVVYRTGDDGVAQFIKIDPGFAFLALPRGTQHARPPRHVRVSTHGHMLDVDRLPDDVKREFVLTLAALVATEEIDFRRLFVRVGAEVFLHYHRESVRDIVDGILGRREVLAEEFSEDLASAKGDFVDMQASEQRAQAARAAAEATDPNGDTSTRPRVTGALLAGKEIARDAVATGEEIGSGSFGSVHAAVWDDRPIALKVLNIRLHDQRMERMFRREVRIMSCLASPFVIRFFGYCRDGDYHAIAMEMADLGSLREVLSNKKEFKLRSAARVQFASDICEGVAYLHGVNVIHRDIKASNVLVTAGMRCKISDFGFSKAKAEFAAHSSSSGGIKGTLAWQAPELFAGAGDASASAGSYSGSGSGESGNGSGKQGGRGGAGPGENTQATDVYSLGVTLWEVATRKRPHRGKTPVEIVTRMVSGYRAKIPRKVSPVLAAAIGDAWAEDPSDRPSAAALARRLRGAGRLADSAAPGPSNRS